MMNLKTAFSSKLSIYCTNRLTVFAIKLATCCAAGLTLHFLHIQTRVSGNMKHTGTKIKSVYKELPINPLNPELNPICYLLALLAHYFLHVSRIRVKSLTIRLLRSYIYIYIYIYIYNISSLRVKCNFFKLSIHLKL